MFLWAIVLSLSTDVPLVVDFNANNSGLHGSLAVKGEIWWTLQTQTPLRFDGQVHSQNNVGLLYVSTNTTQGADVFGSWTRKAHTWAARGQPVLETAYRQYSGSASLVVLEAIALIEWTGTNETTGASPLLQFPGFDLTGGAGRNASYTLWSGLWPIPSVAPVNRLDTELWKRRHDGPVMFTAYDRTAVVVGPVNDTLNIVYTQTGTGTIAFGPSGTLTSVPAGRKFEVMVVARSGPTAALRSYGQLFLLATTGSTVPVPKVPDEFVSYASAFTDNGAYYYWNADGVKSLPPPDIVLPTWLMSLRQEMGIRGLQLDGWWMNQTTLAPNNDLFNGSWDAFRTSIRRTTPLLLYKAFFSEDYDLFAQYEKVQSPKGPFYPTAKDAYKFFKTLFSQGKQLGMTAYETDFMSDHWLPTPGLATDVDSLSTYLQSLGRAGIELGIPMQWCMPTAGIALFAARLSAVTQLRVSVDYACEGPVDLNVTWPANFAIGIGSLLFNAVGLVPSKDVLQTTAHQPGMIPVCGSRHDQPNVELDMVLAVLSGGPVGIGDGVGNTNFTLATHCCRKDGVILKPATPLAAMDSLFVPDATVNNHVGFLPKANDSDGDCEADRPCSPAAHQTYSVVSVLPSYAEEVGIANEIVYPIVVSINLGPVRFPVSDLYPHHAVQNGIYYWREMRWSRNCSSALDRRCGFWVENSTNLPDVSSGTRRLSLDGSISWRMFTLSPMLKLPNDVDRNTLMGWTLLGELSKVVAVSAFRFSNLHIDAYGCLRFALQGSPDETVQVTAIAPDGTFMLRNFVGTHCLSGASSCQICAP